jgi:hypothetical protein
MASSTNYAQPIRGSVVHTEPQDRHVKTYSVFHGELIELTLLNAATALFSSLGSACVSFALSAWLGLRIESTPPPEAKAVVEFIEHGCIAGAIIFFVLAIGSLFWRWSVVSRIKRESRTPGPVKNRQRGRVKAVSPDQ